MECVVLTDEQRQHFSEEGYLIIRNALDAATVEELEKTGDRLMNGFEFSGYYAHRRHGLVQEAAFADLVTHSTTVPLVIQLLGLNIHITNTALIYKHRQQEPDMERNWHRDVGIQLDIGHAAVPLVGLKLGYCLTDFSESGSGMTLVVLKSHRLQEPLSIPAAVLDPPVYEEMQLNPGDAFLFENRLYHAPGFNYSGQLAKQIIYGYHYRWIKPDYYLRYLNGQVQPDGPLLARLDDPGRQLLGATVDSQGREGADGIHWALEAWAEKYKLPITTVPQVVKI